jgi:predicted TIM-barrel fold metal-dependent hydrolase
MIIDSHAHLMLPVEKQITLMEKAGVDRTVLFTTTPHPERAVDLVTFEAELRILYNVLSGSYSLEERLVKMRDTHAELEAVLKQYPDRFLGFGCVPLGLDFQTTGDWIEQQVIARGLVGVGEFTFASDTVQSLKVVLAVLMELPVKLPVWIHTFHPLNLTDLKELVVLARQFPRVPVIFGHMGGFHWLDTIKFAKEQANIYLDLSAAFTTIAPWLAIKELPERTLFSSDAPYGNPFLARKMVETVSESAEVTALVLGENLGRLLNLNTNILKL